MEDVWFFLDSAWFWPIMDRNKSSTLSSKWNQSLLNFMHISTY